MQKIILLIFSFRVLNHTIGVCLYAVSERSSKNKHGIIFIQMADN